MTLEEINKLDIVDYLASLGIHPQKISGHQYWYLSPLPDHAEKTPSFKVNRHLNRWWDFTLKEGSTLIDFGIRYHNCTIAELKERLSGPFLPDHAVSQHHPDRHPTPSKTIEVLHTFPLRSHYLLQYLWERRIPENVARKYTREAQYQFTGSNKQYYAIGFPNDAGGWELRNKYHKYTAQPKSVSHIPESGKGVAVFEGFFNMLSFVAFNVNQEKDLPDLHVLNTAALLESSLPQLDKYDNKYLFLDNDATGDKFTHLALQHDPSYLDLRGLYKGHNDLNDWVRNIGKAIIQPLPHLRSDSGPDPWEGPSEGQRAPRPGR
jgi:Toprim domain-containing protein